MTLNADEIMIKNFESIEIPTLGVDEEYNAAYMTSEDYNNMPNEKTDIDALRSELSEIFYEKFKNYAQFETRCDIKRDTFQKILKYKGGRNITYTTLAKFVVGAGLSVDKAIELFELGGYIVNPDKKLYDYILICALKNGSNLDEFDSDLRQEGCQSIFSKAD